ncbi:MAG: hypothetical protein MNPFHGCM_00001 [Gemmatimonadaceae bacterium]|nr:hypothetical protein [Gemmatimonadaceae bacterium]
MLPYRIPSVVAPERIAPGHDLVAHNTRRIDGKTRRSLVIVVAVERDREPVGIEEFRVSAAESSADLSSVMQPGTDVDRSIVVQDANFSGFRCRLPLFRIHLRKARDGRR